jgi:HEAT repeat protein
MNCFEDSNTIISACLEPDEDARSAGIRKFVEGYSDELGREMAGHLRTSDKTTRGYAMHALAAATPASLPVLIPLMEDGDWVVRYRAAEALGLAGEESAVGVLRVHLTDSKDHVRYMAVKSLGLLHGDVAAEEIAERLCKDENPYVRRMAVRTLARMDAPGCKDLFRRVRMSERDETVTVTLDEALGEAGYDGV